MTVASRFDNERNRDLSGIRTTSRARYHGLMSDKPKPRKTEDIKDQKPVGGETRPPSEPLEDTEKEGFEESQPQGFKDEAEHSIDSAISDPDVEDTKGGE